jgi:hypothetical protein
MIMNTYSNFPHWNSLVVLVTSILLSSPVSAAFIISAEAGCFGRDTYAYHFSETTIIPDYTVKVTSTALLPDITMQLVNDPKQADLILVDEFSKSGMKVCKGSSLAIGVKTIKVSETAILPSITVKLSETSLSPDYKIFVQSRIFTKEEAAALFAVIWSVNRGK